MKALLLTLLHLVVMTARLCGPGGVRAVIAEHFLPQAAADRRAPLRGGASHEAEGRRWARAGRVRAPAGRLRLCVLLQVGDQMVAGLEQFLLVDDVVAVEDGAWPSGCQR